MEAILQNPYALEFVKEQNIKLCVAAVTRNVKVIQFVEKGLLAEVCKLLNILYLPAAENTRDLVITQDDGIYKCYIGCQKGISIDEIEWRIYNKDGGLEKNPHRQLYLDFIKELE